MNKKFTGFTASGLTHPDYGDSVGENVRLQAAMTTSLLEFMAMTFDHERPEQTRLLWDLLNVAPEWAIILTSAPDGVEIAQPAAQRPLSPKSEKGSNSHA